MSKKVLLVSDNHFNRRILSELSMKYDDMDYYLHLGDSEMYADEIKPFIAVRGNNDFDRTFPIDRLLVVDNHKILMTHGHRYISLLSQNDGLLTKAKASGADMVFFGHTHHFADYQTEGIRFVNPGSCNHNRDNTPPSYAIVEFGDDGKVLVKRCNIKL